MSSPADRGLFSSIRACSTSPTEYILPCVKFVDEKAPLTYMRQLLGQGKGTFELRTVDKLRVVDKLWQHRLRTLRIEIFVRRADLLRTFIVLVTLIEQPHRSKMVNTIRGRVGGRGPEYFYYINNKNSTSPSWHLGLMVRRCFPVHHPGKDCGFESHRCRIHIILLFSRFDFWTLGNLFAKRKLIALRGKGSNKPYRILGSRRRCTDT